MTPRAFAPSGDPVRSRAVLAPAHVVADPLSPNEPFGPPLGPPAPPILDWDATLAFRRHLWEHGFVVAEAMDTAHRGLGLDWGTAAELIRRSGAEARAAGGRLAASVWTDQLDPASPHTLKEVIAAYEEQIEVVESAGAQPIIQASDALVAAAGGPEDYLEVYQRLLAQSSKPVVLHWLLPEWNPGHTGYWGHQDTGAGIDAFIELISAHRDKVDGVKIAPLSPEAEIELRRRLPRGVRFYTADLRRYPELIEGDDQGFSDALTPVFDAAAPVAAEAFRSLDAGDTGAFRATLESTVELAGHLWEGPGRSALFFKTGLVFLAWLGGHANHFRMVWGEQAARSVPHLARAYQLADELGVFPDPALAEQRMKTYLATSGISQ